MKIIHRPENRCPEGAKCCRNCQHSRVVTIVQHYYTHDCLICKHPEVEGIIVDDYGYQHGQYAAIHPKCPLQHDFADDICMATKIITVYIYKRNNINYAECPYCNTTNHLPDDKHGFRYCGTCNKIFDIR